MKALLIPLVAAFLFPAGAAYAQEQTPMIFDESDVVVGPQKIETHWLYAAGNWSDGDESLAANCVEIHCYKRFGFCEDAEALIGGVVSLNSYDILRWDNRELIAVDSSPICVVNTLRFDLVAKKVSLSSVQKTDALARKDKFCKDMGGSINPAFLGGVEDRIKRQLNKLNKKE
jgi:hypothetical protein